MADRSIDAQTMATLAQNLRVAEEAFMAADLSQSEANRNRTAALNRLNDHQKKLDDFVQKLKASSPAAGDWKQAEQRRSCGPSPL